MLNPKFYSVRIIILLIVGAPQLFAQLTINTSLTPSQLVQNVLLGNGVIASNITYTGSPNAIAEFGGTTNIGIATGIIMTTGVTTGINGPQGPNGSPSSGMDNGYPGDSLLNSIISDSTHNASVLEFDFVPTGDTIKFHYVFGSEEYPTYACSAYNDIFGFFISGPKPISGSYIKENIALIPGTILPVSIKNINNQGCSMYPQYYVNNGTGNTPLVNTTIQYNGFTKRLTAIAPVVCGSTYHIKLVIADVKDANFDSGVFLEAGSFSSNSISIKAKVGFGSNDTTIFEGCGKSTFILRRSKSMLSKADTVNFSLTGTASNGTDYSLTSSNITGSNIIFPAGLDSIQIDLNAMQDLIAEGIEYFTLTLNIVQCNKTIQKSVTIYINDVAPLTVSTGNDINLSCPGTAITINAVASGGVGIGNYRYSWSTGSSGSGISVNPAATITYIVSVTDTCGIFSAIDTIVVNVNYTPLTLSVSANTEICPGDSTTLAATAALGMPGYKLIWLPGNDSLNSIVVKPNATTTYSVTAADSCGQKETKYITVTVSETNADFNYSFASDLRVDFSNMSTDASNFFWYFGDTASSTLTNPSHTYADSGTYTVTLIASNAIGCTDSVSRTFVLFPDLYFYFPNSFTPNNDGNNDVFAGKGYGVLRYTMKIYDRWGNLIFTGNETEPGWDGKTKNGKAQMDCYVCIFDVEDHFGHSYHKMGNIMLIR
ncbi:MAG: choice-of-anchor L domain-containing protein [Bacteroidetes bacterium]|nr:choice-of-anchor L domain-containing protein [Bacteroidota bacterium]